MRVRARIPKVEPAVMQPPAVCPYEDCQGQYFKDHQRDCAKPLRDTRIDQVTTYRRKCLSCERTHRVYPQGVGRAQQSDRLKGLSILFYVLGISYRGVEDMLEAFGLTLDHTSVYHNVQAAGEQVRLLRRAWLQAGGKVMAVGADVTYVQCRGDRVALAVAVDSAEGIVLDIEILENEETETIEAWLKPLLELVGAEVLTTDDQDGFKAVADRAGVSHQICRRHVTLNMLDFIAKTAERVLTTPPPIPVGLEVTPAQLLEDLEQLEWIVLGQPENAPQLLGALYDRYAKAAPPKKGKRASVWYRMRNHVLRAWNHWQRYTCYRNASVQDEYVVPETNNAAERAIGWNIKERYRTMRGYKRDESILNVAMLTAWLRDEPNAREMSSLFAV